MTPIAEPFCDNLRLTFPQPDRDAAPPVLGELLTLLFPLGIAARADGKSWDIGPYGGVLFAARSFSVFSVQLSGAALRAVRESEDLMLELCLMFERHSHTVTRLDASCDYAIAAPPFLFQLYRRVRRSPLAIGGKLVTIRDIERHTSFNTFGESVDNLYLGKKSAEVRVLVYDKRHERIEKGGEDPGDCLRVEVRLKSQVRCTVWDAYAPERVYYHYAAPSLVELPPSVRSWEPNGEGFVLQRKQNDFTPYARMLLLVKESPVIGQLLRLARQDTSGGIQSVLKLIQRRFDGEALPVPSVPSLVG